ncbi:MAG: DUF2007 domain-containing protein [Candidatus Marinimicrobia bacterium]|nr:DUF2007 domain-containing protein [Candidatus Neomarinimicrobiota bacterium]
MPYCPQCRYEFKEGIKKCPDCETELVEELDEELEHKFVLIENMESDLTAEMIKEALENNEIPSIIKSDFFHEGFLAEPANLPGSHSAIFVPDDQVEKAREIIDNITKEK